MHEETDIVNIYCAFVGQIKQNYEKYTVITIAKF
jgi:hypothetical protein